MPVESRQPNVVLIDVPCHICGHVDTHEFEDDLPIPTSFPGAECMDCFERDLPDAKQTGHPTFDPGDGWLEVEGGTKAKLGEYWLRERRGPLPDRFWVPREVEHGDYDDN